MYVILNYFWFYTFIAEFKSKCIEKSIRYFNRSLYNYCKSSFYIFIFLTKDNFYRIVVNHIPGDLSLNYWKSLFSISLSCIPRNLISNLKCQILFFNNEISPCLLSLFFIFC